MIFSSKKTTEELIELHDRLDVKQDDSFTNYCLDKSEKTAAVFNLNTDMKEAVREEIENRGWK